MMTISLETLLNIFNFAGLVFTASAFIWELKTKFSKASQIAYVLAATFLTIVQTGMIANNIINDKSWVFNAFLMLLWLFNVVYKAIDGIRKQDN